MILFLYGTLLDRATLARRSACARLAGCPAVLTGWRRVVLRGTCYPTLRRSRVGSVAGRVVRVSADALRRLAAYEGPAYRLRRMIVATPAGPVAAWTWVAAAATGRRWD